MKIRRLMNMWLKDQIALDDLIDDTIWHINDCGNKWKTSTNARALSYFSASFFQEKQFSHLFRIIILITNLTQSAGKTALITSGAKSNGGWFCLDFFAYFLGQCQKVCQRSENNTVKTTMGKVDRRRQKYIIKTAMTKSHSPKAKIYCKKDNEKK